MATNDRNRRDRDDRDAPKAQPWDLFRIVEVFKRDEKVEEWVQCGVLWRMKEHEGFTWTQHFTIPEGARMAAMARKQKDNGR